MKARVRDVKIGTEGIIEDGGRVERFTSYMEEYVGKIIELKHVSGNLYKHNDWNFLSEWLDFEYAGPKRKTRCIWF